MARILFVHGIGQQRTNAAELQDRLIGPLNDGLRGLLAPLRPQEFACAYYADLFLPAGMKGRGDPPYGPEDVNATEAELLELWWREAAQTDAAVVSPQAAVKVRTPRTVQYALHALSRSVYFASIAERTLIADLKQVTTYMGPLRRAIQERVQQEITPEVRVVVGHSLGSVVAYECLAQDQASSVRMLITIGSPLGIRNLIFDRLEPPPHEGQGAWPGSVAYWINVADTGDVVALEKKLSRLFGPRVQDRVANNHSQAHDASPYLSARVTGEAIALGLRGQGQC